MLVPDDDFTAVLAAVRALRKGGYEPWLAMSVVKAFYEAKQLAMAEMREVAVLPTMLPWLSDDLERVQAQRLHVVA